MLLYHRRPPPLARHVETAAGSTLEIRLPLSMLGNKLGFAIADVDNPQTRQVEMVIGTSDTQTVAELGTVMFPSPEIASIIKGLARTTSRIWVLDRNRLVLAQAFTLERAAVESALAGDTGIQRRRSADHQAVVLSAAHPIWVEETVMGAVVVEETTNAILTLQHRALENLLNVTLVVFLLGTVTLFTFASRLSVRLRRLRNEAEPAHRLQRAGAAGNRRLRRPG